MTVVEFFDFRCPYCKASAPVVEKLLQAEPKVRLVLKDIPILGPDSLAVAKVGEVANRHGRFKEYWDRIYALKDKATGESAIEVAHAIGLDPAAVRKEMESPDVERVLKRNTELARNLKIDGTPTFIIGSVFFPGAVSLEDMRAQVAAVRKGPA